MHPQALPSKEGGSSGSSDVFYQCCPGLTYRGDLSLLHPSFPRPLITKSAFFLSKFSLSLHLHPQLRTALFLPVAKTCSVNFLQFDLCTDHQDRKLKLCSSCTHASSMAPHCPQSLKFLHLHTQDPCDMTPATFSTSKSSHCSTYNNTHTFINLQQGRKFLLWNSYFRQTPTFPKNSPPASPSPGSLP